MSYVIEGGKLVTHKINISIINCESKSTFCTFLHPMMNSGRLSMLLCIMFMVVLSVFGQSNSTIHGRRALSFESPSSASVVSSDDSKCNRLSSNSMNLLAHESVVIFMSSPK